jgi:predicted O-methyltransferase YrrM
LIAAFLRHRWRAGDAHAIHSPFLFDLYTRTIRADDRQNPAFTDIEALRYRLLANKTQLTITDLGAGSRKTTATTNAPLTRNVADIARQSQKPARFGRLLFRLAQSVGVNKPVIFDLGTSLGLTTAYLSRSVESLGGCVTTFEGCPETAAVARQNLAGLGCTNVSLVVGNLDDTLSTQLAQIDRLDLIFFDANHRSEPTLRYFNASLQKAHNDTVFVFDDIHWSADMEQAWADIKTHPAVSLTVDLFWVGLVFIRREQPVQHFDLRF